MFGQPVTLTSSSTGNAAGFATGTAGRTDNPIVMDWMKSGTVTIQSIVNTTGSGLTYNVEYSLDTPTTVTSTAGSSQMNWFSSGSSALSTHAIISLAFPVRSLRINATANTSNNAITLTVVQSAL